MWTVRDLEAILKIDAKTIYGYMQRGLIPHVRIQSNVRFLRSQISGARIAEVRAKVGQSKRYLPVFLRRQICCPRVRCDNDLCFFQIGLGEDFGLPVPGMGKNQARVLQLAQQFRMLLRKKFESPGLVGLCPGHFQDNRGETGDLRIVRFRHLSQASHILFGDMRLFEKSEDIVLILDGSALGLGLAARLGLKFPTLYSPMRGGAKGEEAKTYCLQRFDGG
jgi:hypothetical protein